MPEHPILGRLANKVCVIAGAAGVIGEAAAERLRREGATVVGSISESTRSACSPCKPT
jgi:NAD(P)-dependent dehydrogenase (short-subunit alcohol dehydrogenase family)